MASIATDLIARHRARVAADTLAACPTLHAGDYALGPSGTVYEVIEAQQVYPGAGWNGESYTHTSRMLVAIDPAESGVGIVLGTFQGNNWVDANGPVALRKATKDDHRRFAGEADTVIAGFAHAVGERRIALEAESLLAEIAEREGIKSAIPVRHPERIGTPTAVARGRVTAQVHAALGV